MKDIISVIGEGMNLRQKVEWSVNTCISLQPYVPKTWKEQNEKDIAIGQAWLNGETHFKTGWFKKQGQDTRPALFVAYTVSGKVCVMAGWSKTQEQ